MPSVSVGQVGVVFCPLAGNITITPGASGRVSFQSRGRDGSQSAAPREMYTAETVSVSAGDTVSIEAINADATYSEPSPSGFTLPTTYPDPRLFITRASLPLTAGAANSVYDFGATMRRVIGIAITNSSAGIDLTMDATTTALQSGTATNGPYVYQVGRPINGITTITLGANARAIVEVDA